MFRYFLDVEHSSTVTEAEQENKDILAVPGTSRDSSVPLETDNGGLATSQGSRCTK